MHPKSLPWVSRMYGDEKESLMPLEAFHVQLLQRANVETRRRRLSQQQPPLRCSNFTHDRAMPGTSASIVRKAPHRALPCVGSRVEVDKVGQAASKKINAARTTTEWEERCSPKSTMSGRSVADASFSRVSICCRMCAHTESEGLNILPTCRFSSTFRSI